MPRIPSIAAALASLLFLTAAAPVTAADGPGAAARRVVERFHATVLDIMKNAATLGIAGRFTRFGPAIERDFNTQLMISLATGSYWRKADAETRRNLADAFRKLSTATYASRFKGYSGERFDMVGVEPGPRKTQIVRTRIVPQDGSPRALSYVLRDGATGWRIVDVLLDDGISELAVRRSEYSTVLSSSGTDGLVKLLNDKTAQLLGR